MCERGDFPLPELIAGIAELRDRLDTRRRRGASIGLVPTMGALHRGHAKLLERARQENDFVVASIFVNPIQFDRREDLERYPRTMEEDLAVCESYGVNLIFAPSTAELYPREQLVFVESPVLSAHLCGAHRPGHFRGVATVVLKLFNIVQPDRAYFGEKDAQQLALIRRMVEDLNVPVAVVPVATVREEDGLALSSRNKHLTAEQRKIAPVLFRALLAAVDTISGGERSVEDVRARAVAVLAEHPEVRVEYFDITDPDTMTPVERIEGPVLVAGAVWIGSTRLIDNVRWPG
jgi:pantoate--beta-alanine ligase